MNHRILIVLPAVVAAATIAPKVYAVCADNTESRADFKMFLNNPCGNQRTSNIHTMQADYDFTDDDWQLRGELVDLKECAIGILPAPPPPAAADVGELSKHLNAFMLLGAGINFTQGPNLIVESMHSSWVPAQSNGDYLPLTSADTWHGWHNWFRHQVVDQLSTGSFITFAQFQPRGCCFLPDLVQLSCTMYDDLSPAFGRLFVDDPAQRAETIVHEAWHAWENSHNHPWDTSCGHQSCGSFSNTTCLSGNECDTWYPHNAVGAGGMNNKMHRPYQAAVEFACDLVNTPSEEVFDSLIELAADDADYMGVSDFINGPMPACLGFNFGQRYATCNVPGGTQCDEADPCKSGLLCNPGSGCCVQPVCAVAGGTSCDGSCTCDFSTGCCATPPPPPK